MAYWDGRKTIALTIFVLFYVVAFWKLTIVKFPSVVSQILWTFIATIMTAVLLYLKETK